MEISLSLLIGLTLTILVGLLLGMVGGGGSIVVVPILVYVVGFSASAAIALSLPIVGGTSLIGAIAKARRGEVQINALIAFGVIGGIGAILGAKLTKHFQGSVLLLFFALLLLFVGIRMWRGQETYENNCENECHYGRCAGAGFSIGVLTGFLGVGGGFLLVPALRRFARQSMKTAVGTSLGIIALNSAAGFAAHFTDVRMLLPQAAAFTAAALIGLFAGLSLAKRFHPHHLEKTFAAVALAVSAYLIIVNLPAAYRGFLG